MKKSAIFVCLLCVLLMVASCAKNTSSEKDYAFRAAVRAKGGSKDTVVVWALDSMGYMDTIVGIIEASGLPYNVEIEYAYNFQKEKTRMTTEQVDDALRTLNARLLAGSGPDIIVLDGCPAKSMANSGILQSLNGIAEQAGVYENLTQGLADDKGEVYYLPLRIDAPVLAGPPDLLAQMPTLQDIIGLIQSYPNEFDFPEGYASADDPLLLTYPKLQEEQQALLGLNSISYDVMQITTPLFYNDIAEGTAINSVALKEYFLTSEQMINAAGLNDEAYGPFPYAINILSPDFRSNSSATNYYLGNTKAVAESASYLDYGFIGFAALVRGEEIEVKPFEEENAVWQPIMLMGINAKSKNKELAEDFLLKMLSDETQLSPYVMGLPVTKSSVEIFSKTVFDERLKKYKSQVLKAYGEDSEITTIFTEEQTLPYNLDELMRSFNTPYIINNIVNEHIFYNCLRYINGHISLEEAVERVEKELKFYYLEKE